VVSAPSASFPPSLPFLTPATSLPVPLAYLAAEPVAAVPVPEARDLAYPPLLPVLAAESKQRLEQGQQHLS